MAAYFLLPVNLRMFDGEGGAPTGETQASSGRTHQGESGEIEVRYGKQPAEETSQQQSSDAGSDTPADPAEQQPAPTPQDKRKAFRELVTGEYKDIYAEDTQRIINRRFRETQEQISQTQPIIDMLMQRYNISGDLSALQNAIESDTAYWQEAADAAGMTAEAYRKNLRDQRELSMFRAAEQNMLARRAEQQQYAQWEREAEMLKGKVPGFDLASEVQNPQFMSMLRARVPLEHAYKALHHDEILETAIRTTVQDTEKRIVDNVRAKGARPAENGTAKQSAFVVKDDPSKFTKQDRAEIARKVKRGEKIYL